jgi:hypothetical protein
MTPLGYQQITSVSSSVGFTIPTVTRNGVTIRADYALVTPQTQAVRWRDDGTNPSATVGYPLAVGQELAYTGDLGKIKFYEQAASAALNVSYYLNEN